MFISILFTYETKGLQYLLAKKEKNAQRKKERNRESQKDKNSNIIIRSEIYFGVVNIKHE